MVSRGWGSLLKLMGSRVKLCVCLQEVKDGG